MGAVSRGPKVFPCKSRKCSPHSVEDFLYGSSGHKSCPRCLPGMTCPSQAPLLPCHIGEIQWPRLGEALHYLSSNNRRPAHSFSAFFPHYVMPYQNTTFHLLYLNGCHILHIRVQFIYYIHLCIGQPRIQVDLNFLDIVVEKITARQGKVGQDHK